MKKIIFLLTLSFAINSHAGLTSDCKSSVYEVAQDYFNIVDKVESGIFKKSEADFLIGMKANNAKIAALTCAGIKKISLEKNPVLPAFRINRIVEKTEQNALDYYNDLTSQGVER